MNQKTAVIIGAGPAGLTAGEQLLIHTNIKPIILEADSSVGGLSKTLIYKNNRIDIGGHRFFSKSDWVMKWWLSKLKAQCDESGKPLLNSEKDDDVFLLCKRHSSIFFNNKFFTYPIQLNIKTLKTLGFVKSITILLSYIKYRIFPVKNATNLESFFTNRFGKQLYQTFFKDYTEKVWGVNCSEISASWGESRIKQLSVAKALKNSLKSVFYKNQGLSQKQTETSLISQFLYPKYGPGQLWEKVAEEIKNKSGEIHLNLKVKKITYSNSQINSIIALNTQTNKMVEFKSDYLISTMPIKDLINSMNVSGKVQQIANNLPYRDFIIVGLLVDSKYVKNLHENWIYIQDKKYKLGRIQVFNNWSPYLAADNSKTWLGLEYFCNENDDFWIKSENEIAQFAINEIINLGLVSKNNIVDSVVYKIQKAYPAYFGAYSQFDKIQEFTNQITNLYLIGRNGMHRYNNQDHSMLSAKLAVENIANNITDNTNIWNLDTESTYIESKHAE